MRTILFGLALVFSCVSSMGALLPPSFKSTVFTTQSQAQVMSTPLTWTAAQQFNAGIDLPAAQSIQFATSVRVYFDNLNGDLLVFTNENSAGGFYLDDRLYDKNGNPYSTNAIAIQGGAGSGNTLTNQTNYALFPTNFPMSLASSNGLQVSSQSKPYHLGNGQWYGTPVPFLRPVTPYNGIAFDIMPHTIKTNVWIDICSDDFTQSQNGEFLHLEKLPDGNARIGASALGTGVVRDLHLQPYGGHIYYGPIGTSVHLVPNQAAVQEIPGGAFFWAQATNYSIGIGPGATRFVVNYNDGSTWRAGITLLSPSGNVGIGTTAPLFTEHVVGNSYVTNGAILQAFTVAAPTAPLTQGAAYWNDGTNVCVVLRNGAGTLTTNKLTMSAWP